MLTNITDITTEIDIYFYLSTAKNKHLSKQTIRDNLPVNKNEQNLESNPQGKNYSSLTILQEAPTKYTNRLAEFLIKTNKKSPAIWKVNAYDSRAKHFVQE